LLRRVIAYPLILQESSIINYKGHKGPGQSKKKKGKMATDSTDFTGVTENHKEEEHSIVNHQLKGPQPKY